MMLRLTIIALGILAIVGLARIDSGGAEPQIQIDGDLSHLATVLEGWQAERGSALVRARAGLARVAFSQLFCPVD
jgi:hypothetical protein